MEWFAIDLKIFDQRINIMTDLYQGDASPAKHKNFNLLIKSIQAVTPRLSNEGQLAYMGRLNLIARDIKAFWCIPKSSQLYKQLTAWYSSFGLKECSCLHGYIEAADAIYYLGSLSFKSIGHELLGGNPEDDYTTTAAFLIFATKEQ